MRSISTGCKRSVAEQRAAALDLVDRRLRTPARTATEREEIADAIAVLRGWEVVERDRMNRLATLNAARAYTPEQRACVAGAWSRYIREHGRSARKKYAIPAIAAQLGLTPNMVQQILKGHGRAPSDSAGGGGEGWRVIGA